MSDARRTGFLYYGHSTVSFSLSNGEVILIDPFIRSNPSCPAALHDLGRMDAMLITHAHVDHFADVVELAKEYRPKKIAANYEISHWLDSQGLENVSPMGPGGSQEVLGIKVTMVRADHSSGLEDGSEMRYGGVAGGFVVEMPAAEGGLRFYHAGDTALFGDMKLIAEIYRPELAFLPIGDLFTMGPTEAAWACKLLQLRRMVPIHWGTFPFLTGTPQELEKELARLGVECEVLRLEPGESLEA